jgi:hypothetical protein
MLRAARWIRVALPCLALVALSACAHAGSGGAPGAAEDESDLVTLRVANAYKLNIVVYNVGHGARDRLGEVTAVSTKDIRVHLRRLAANEMQLFADPVGGGRGITSETLHLTAGDRVDWILEYDLSRSHIEIH